MLNEKSVLLELERTLQELTRTSFGRRTFLTSVPWLMVACATGERTRYREGDNAGQETSLTVDDEKRMAREALVEMRKDYPALADSQLQTYINGLGAKLVRANQLSGHPYTYTFTVVDVPQVNAFALPAGTVFVTAPLLAMAESEAELAGVLGHEIGHVKARHAAERIDRAEKEKGQGLWYAIGGGVLGGAAGFGLGRLLCPPQDSKCVAQAAALGAAAGAGGGLLIQKYKFMANSREDEMEADRIGFKVAARAGYAPDHIGDFYTKLQRMEEKSEQGGAGVISSLADAMSTHPPSRERVTQMRELVSSTARSPRAIVSSTEFDRARKRVAALVRERK